MTLIQLLIILAVLILVCFVAHWIITKFFTEPLRTPAYIIVGVIALIFLLVKFFPQALNIKVGG